MRFFFWGVRVEVIRVRLGFFRGDLVVRGFGVGDVFLSVKGRSKVERLEEE